MKKISLFAFLVFAFITGAVAQIESPVLWSYTAKKIAPKTYELHMTATINDRWHIYSQDAGEGPEPTSFAFTANPLVKLEGKVMEVGKLEKSYDPNFKSTLRFYADKVDFVQKIILKSTVSTIVKGTVTYMVCDDKNAFLQKKFLFL